MTTLAPASTNPSRWARWGRLPLALLAVVALWIGVVGAWLPSFLRPRIEAAATQALGEPVVIHDLHIHPLSWVVALDGLRVGPAALPILQVQKLEVQLSLESLWRLAPVLRRVSVVKPDLWIERQSANTFNFSALLARLQAQPQSAPVDSGPARFAVFNIVLQDGVVRYTDRVLGQSHRIDQLHLGVPFVSSLPSHIQVEVQPSLSAHVDGSPIQIKGSALPFYGEGFHAQVQLNADGMDVPHWLMAVQPFLPADLQIKAQSGRLDTALTVQFDARQPPAVPRLAIQGGFKLSQLDVGMVLPAAAGVSRADTAWTTLAVDGVDALPLERQVHVGSIALDGVRLQALLAPAPAQRPLGQKQQPATSGAPWAWRVGKLRINTGSLSLQPQNDMAKDKAWPTVAALRISAEGLSSDKSAVPASWHLEVRDDLDASLLAQGHVQLAKQLVDGHINLDKLPLQGWLRPLSRVVPLPLQVKQGQLAVQAQFSARLKTASALEPAQARLLSGHVRLSQLNAVPLNAKGGDHLQFDSLSVDGIQAQVDMSTRTSKPNDKDSASALNGITIERLDIAKLDAAITRGVKGDFFGLPINAGASKQAPAASQAQAQMALKALTCADCLIRFTDQAVSPSAQFELKQTSLNLADLSHDLSRPIKLDVSTVAQGRGRVQITGALTPEPLSLNARVRISGLDLAAVQPYIDPMANIRLVAARAQVDGQVDLQAEAQGGLKARYKGRLGIGELRVQDRVNDADFLKWQALTLDGVDMAWANQTLDADLGRIALQDFYGRVIINPDGHLNLAGIMRHEAGAEPRSLTTPQAKAASAPDALPAPAKVAQATSTAPKLRWQQVRLSKGRIDFTDNFIKPNYSAHLTQLEGDVSAVASSRPDPATINVSAAVDDGAPLLITGQVNPLGPKLYTDIQGSAKGIELTRLTPYAARYAGYGIDKGTLSVTVHYKVDGGKLEASNQIFLDQLTFGDKVDSPDATDLPVRFAVSLLQNRKGEIDVNLPISGSLDDPEFSVGGIIWHVLANLITKAVTAPFALLGGGDAGELGYVPFDPGSSSLTGAAQKVLDTLASKLNDRPGLKLEATGRADPAQDAQGLRQRYLDALLRAAKARSASQAPADVQIEPGEQSIWLAAAYKAAGIPKPTNLIGLAKTLPDKDMAALLMASAPVGAEALQSLANQRGDQVKAYLANKMPPERVLLTASKVGAVGLSDDKGPLSRVQFEIK
ncbi:MAG: DUF748 domain-containing protein [Aquabacterium sp.]|nr:DUF748 domain-containing protein [Aquabacterium sp.]